MVLYLHSVDIFPPLSYLIEQPVVCIIFFHMLNCFIRGMLDLLIFLVVTSNLELRSPGGLNYQGVVIADFSVP